MWSRKPSWKILKKKGKYIKLSFSKRRILGYELDSSGSSEASVARSWTSGNGIFGFYTLRGIWLPTSSEQFEISENLKDAARNVNVRKEEFYSFEARV